jgi:hypothetical protein
LKWYSPFASLDMVTGSRLDTTIRCCESPNSKGASGAAEGVGVSAMAGRVL